MLRMQSYDVQPATRFVEGKLVHPLEAYAGAEYWLEHFESIFPEKAARMHAYSERRGWTKLAHVRNWIPVCLRWLDKQA